MKTICKKVFVIFLVLCGYTASFGQELTVSKYSVVLSAIKGTVSRADTVQISSSNEKIEIGAISIKGKQADYFKLISPKLSELSENATESLVLVFKPAENFIGIAKATLSIEKLNFSIQLTGLSTKGLEGENESPLSKVVEALGYKIDVGWTSLANHLRPEPQGEELAPALFKKAERGKVEMIPIARYSPDFSLNFGYYTSSKSGPVQHQVGILATADKFPEHQTLFPRVATGKTVFDPGEDEFGFYAISPSHSVYSEDIWNILFYPTHATHAVRTYPVRDKNGVMLENTYLVCIEEAANGDYNDYVFLVKNIKPVLIQHEFNSLFNGKDFTGWYTWLEGKGRNNDPEGIFSVQQDGIIHDIGKDLGYIMTEKSFGNYHFSLEFKWGEKRWPPRDDAKRDSGICYNIPVNEPDSIWPSSVECQIQEGDVGDFWLLGYSTIQVDGKQNYPYKHSRMEKKKDAEKPNGEWNTVEVISFNGKCVHIVNGVVVNYGENSSLIGGRILLQSEYAELYYRNIKLRDL
jgi:3-keto-disaccharide hydrolase